MKSILFFLAFSIPLVISAQSNFTEQDAKQLVDTFFEGFHKGDTVMMRSVLAPSVRLQTAASDKDGVAQLSDDSILNLLNAIANRPADQNWEERLLDYKVQVDGNIAHVWTPYEFWFNGNFSHCGANAFTIAKTEAGWKIIHLIDSRRREGCRE
ncbi:MAG TPA: nuclear transport factor 2 family protein [Flavobacteriaceae bacterium]|nr:nuclear transport factor 2 family protein [Flavobacteriaceae bacterium]HIN98656.1 nuclear transport factor 2 family protein [Flavobacteriaceae bacterium]|tara:strand:- start:132298 stop:132759 length:462 start_codon:yes stop_codon:yes gene_type:complete